MFIKTEYKVGQKVKLTNNKCSEHCPCGNAQIVADNYNLQVGKVYEIESVHHFGGGCPSTTIVLKNESQTNDCKFFPGPSAVAFVPINLKA
jgi:hypothetical protein